MIVLFSILILLGIVLLVIPKKDTENNEIANAIGIGFIIGAIALIVPIIIEKEIKNIKEEGIEQFINGEVQIVHTSDSTHYFLWSNSV